MTSWNRSSRGVPSGGCRGCSVEVLRRWTVMANPTPTPTRRPQRRLPRPPLTRLLRRRRTQLVLFLGILGPGLITSAADNDAGGIFTYASAGARYGYDMLWLLVLVTLALVVGQELHARMGASSGKGLADLIRERF